MAHHSHSQTNPYIIYFTDKATSSYSISSPENYLSAKAIARRSKSGIAITHADLPVYQPYLDSLATKGATVLYPLKWSNAAVILAEPSQVAAISNLPFVKQNYSVAKKKYTSLHSIAGQNQPTKLQNINSSTNVYGNSFNQIQMLGADQMHNEGFHGEGITIAVFDAGFKNASSVPYLNHVFSNNRILATYDFVDFETNVYDNHEHGLQAMSAIASYQEGSLIGTAYNASFVLLRTENEFSESQLEEANWARGAEYADSIGADIISASLGYYTFDNTASNHTYQDLNGRTTIASIAAAGAASRGILVVTSAGNEGNSAWRYIITPADADSVLAIGAVDASERYVSFSSVGPTVDGRIKPDLAAKGTSVTLGTPSGTISNNSGTSFSCPLVAGLAAGLWQAYPNLTNMQLQQVLKKTASQAEQPDNILGYGIPNFVKAKQFIQDSIYFTGIDIVVFPNPIQEEKLYFSSGSEYIGSEATIRINDMLGRELAEFQLTIQNIKTEIPILTSNLKNGVYSLRITLRDQTVKKIFVKN